MRSSFQHIGILCVALVALGSAVATGVQAEDALRWKFKVGEKLDYNMTQEMKMAISGAPFPQPINTDMRQEMDMTWEVLGVDDKSGEAVIRQKFERVKMKMNSPLGSFDFDSKSEEPPTGLAANIAPMYKAMTEGEFEITMTSRGEVKDVKIPEQILTALKNSPAAAQMGDVATSEGFKKMISQGALVLPKDPPKKGDSWSTRVDMKNPAVGKQSIETTYRFEGTKEIDGNTFAIIKPQLKMEFEKPAAPAEGDPKQPAEQQPPPATIKEQSSDGEVLFNITDGRLKSTTLQQSVTIGTNAAGQPIEQKIEQKIGVTVTPSGEKKAAAEKAPEAKKSESSGEKAEATK